jgi:hypothetical protein
VKPTAVAIVENHPAPHTSLNRPASRALPPFVVGALLGVGVTLAAVGVWFRILSALPQRFR